MSLKDRIIQAKAHGGFSNNGELASAVSRAAKREIPPQSLQKLIGPKANPAHSSLLPFIAEACHVNLEWLTTGAGSMAGVSEPGTQYLRNTRALMRLRDAMAGLFHALDDLEPGSPERKVIEDEIAKHQQRRKRGDSKRAGRAGQGRKG